TGASGPNYAKPHHGVEDRVIEQGDLITIEFRAHLRGFKSDMTRTFVAGEVTDFSTEIYDIVLEAQLAVVAAATPGTALYDVERACRQIIEDAGHGASFFHNTGHGNGLH